HARRAGERDRRPARPARAAHGRLPARRVVPRERAALGRALQRAGGDRQGRRPRPRRQPDRADLQRRGPRGQRHRQPDDVPDLGLGPVLRLPDLCGHARHEGRPGHEHERPGARRGRQPGARALRRRQLRRERLRAGLPRRRRDDRPLLHVRPPRSRARRVPAAPLAMPAARLRSVVSSALVVIALAIAPDTLKSDSLSSAVLPFTSFLAIAALGQMLVIMTGGIDLSVPGTIAIVAHLVVGVSGSSNGKLATAILACVGWAALIGLVNGVLVSVLRLNALIVTLAVGQIVLGITIQYSSGIANESAVPSSLSTWATNEWLGVSWLFWMGVFITIVLALV